MDGIAWCAAVIAFVVAAIVLAQCWAAIVCAGREGEIAFQRSNEARAAMDRFVDYMVANAKKEGGETK